MNSRRFTRPFQPTIAAGALAALFAAAPAQAADQDAWLQQQLAISDGGSYPSFVATERSPGGYQADAQSVWLQEQLAISDGSAPIGRGPAAVYAASRRTATASVK
jgi:hypothetical protein